MWVTTLEEIARHAAEVVTVVRTHARYDVPTFPDAPILRDGVLVTPMLIRCAPLPERRILGNLRDRALLLAVLGRGAREP